MERLAFALVAVGLVCLAPSIPALGAERVPCGPAGAKTLARGLQVRVFEERDYAYACMRGSGQRRPLASTYCYGSSSGCVTFRAVAVAGSFVAYAIQADGDVYGDEAFSLSVLDMRARKLRERQEFGDYQAYNASIVRIVLRASGSAAWLWRRSPTRGGAPVHVVSRSTRCGEPTTLAEGPDVAASALWRKGTKVYWRQGNADRNAELC